MDTLTITTPKRIITIRKASGEEQPYLAIKLERSLVNAGAHPDLAKEIVAEISAWIYDGVSTQKIFQRAFSLLRKKKSHGALRYRLKQAMLELGPTGYPFELLMGLLFEKLGYQCQVGVTVNGKCITHEMDVIATREKEQHLMECKYHSDQGHQVSVQVPLYVRSRVDDIVGVRKLMPEYQGFEFTGWVVTNTRFSGDSIGYGNGSGLKLLAWDYPEGNGLKEMLEREKIFPITILTYLTAKQKQQLLQQDIVICSQLKQQPEVLNALELTPNKRKALEKELKEICNGWLPTN
ncbi:restriction endonuclease [Breznakibacter xylanolyticus]|uniref:Restriction endonuclease n=1 Tax=Breznakibacter xylanolyticus TaxID=990 RepID=A0A2W7Q227_9BACT|nr:restriction endonuclease [Breznakibacter xylanolyticus]PZX15859.1 restriction endonuclease [Breznakibacter xylanolyticus]